MIYCWSEPAYPGEYKVGEHWVSDMTLDDAIQHTIAGRIRSSLGVRKDLFDRDRIKVHFVIDASVYARQKNKFHPRSKLDAELHQLIEGRYGLGEVFDCEYQQIVDVIEREIDKINTHQVEVTIKSKSFKKLLKMKDRASCILDQGDPKDVWKEIVDRIPFTRKRPSFLIVACGYGTEVSLLIERLQKLGWSDTAIKRSITINDRSDQFTKTWEEAGYTTVVGDLLYLDFGMKFDIILGNPPYQDSTTGSGKLYPKFFAKCFDDLLIDDGYLGFITPMAWMSHFNDENERSRNKELDRMKHAMRSNFLVFVDFKETLKHFEGVGSTFSSYILQKSTVKGKTYIRDSDEYLDVPYMKSFPKDFSVLSFSIFNKMKSDITLPLIEGGTYAHMGFHSGPADKKAKKPITYQTSEYCNPLFHTNGIILYSDIKHPLQDSKKVIASLSGYFSPRFDDGELGLSQHGVAILVENEEAAKSVISILNSKLYGFLMEQTKHSGFTNQYSLRSMPFLTTDQIWSDADIYHEFGLTSAEINYIEESSK